MSIAPYKTNLGASFPWVEGATANGPAADAGYRNGGYFNLKPGEVYVGGGMWAPEKGQIEAFRRAVVEDPDRVKGALEDPAFLAAFGAEAIHPHGTLKRVPAGYPADHPMADVLRYKDVVFGRQLSDDEVRSPSLPDVLADAYAAAAPVFRFLGGLGH